MIVTEKISVTTTGSAGSATGNTSGKRTMVGEVKAIYVDWHDDAPNTSDIDVVCESDTDHPEITLYDKDNAATDIWIYPTIEETDTAGAGRSTYREIPVSGTIKVTVGGCDALTDAVVVYVYVME